MFTRHQFRVSFPTLITQQVNLAYPDREWRLHNAWFVKQKDFYTTFKPRRILPPTT